MSEKQRASEGDSLRYQLSDSAERFRADSSAFGMGSFSDFHRHLVLPLQHRFQEGLPRNESGRDHDREAGEYPVYRTLHDELRDYVLELASAIRHTAVQSRLLAGAVRAAYQKYIARLFVR